MRQLTDSEIDKLEFLTSKSIEVALIEPTVTGVKKSIMDATLPVRDFLVRARLHDYTQQQKGPDNKIQLKTHILHEHGIEVTSTSLYRPMTKNGDPRIWVSKIKQFCMPGDIIALTGFEGELWVFNLTKLNVAGLYQSNTVFTEFVAAYSSREGRVSVELLSKLREISARGFIQSRYIGDTSIGRLLETELGIEINSSKNPDYKGIEIKSSRAERKNRMNLFAQVPDWSISRLKSSRHILDNYGYHNSKGIKKLYCTVSSQTYNSQGLKLTVDENKGLLNEVFREDDINVVSWKLRNLEARLLEKHSETFWVEADVKRDAEGEWFKFTKVEHTKDPMIAQLSILLSQGKVTVDHLIKEKGKSASEKGPLFKLAHNSLDLLFPPSETYYL